MINHQCIDTICIKQQQSKSFPSWNNWIREGVTLVALDLKRILTLMVVWQTRIRNRTHLRNMDTRLLDDMNITWEQARLESEKPFWRG